MTWLGTAYHQNRDVDPLYARDQLREWDAKAGSDRLRDACNSLFTRFEVRHRLAQGMGEKLQLEGYRA